MRRSAQLAAPPLLSILRASEASPDQNSPQASEERSDTLAEDDRATWFEELLALCIDDPALPPIELQHTIVNSAGEFVARPDVAFPTVRLGLEAHSRRFHFGPDAEKLDEDRDLRAALAGWELIYLGWYATRRPADVCTVIGELVRVRRRELRVTEV